MWKLAGFAGFLVYCFCIIECKPDNTQNDILGIVNLVTESYLYKMEACQFGFDALKDASSIDGNSLPRVSFADDEAFFKKVSTTSLIRIPCIDKYYLKRTIIDKAARDEVIVIETDYNNGIKALLKCNDFKLKHDNQYGGDEDSRKYNELICDFLDSFSIEKTRFDKVDLDLSKIFEVKMKPDLGLEQAEKRERPILLSDILFDAQRKRAVLFSKLKTSEGDIDQVFFFEKFGAIWRTVFVISQ